MGRITLCCLLTNWAFLLSYTKAEQSLPEFPTIRPVPCSNRMTGESGVCTFNWSCVNVAHGVHIGPCVDRFFVGSCCKIPNEDGIAARQPSIAEDTGKTEEDNKVEVPTPVRNVFAAANSQQEVKKPTTVIHIEHLNVTFSTHYGKHKLPATVEETVSQSINSNDGTVSSYEPILFDKTNFWEKSSTAPHNSRRPMFPGPPFHNRPSSSFFSNDNTVSVTPETSYDEQKPTVQEGLITNHKNPVGGGQRKPVTNYASHDNRKPILQDATHDQRRPVVQDPSHNQRRPVIQEATHDQRRPLFPDDSHDLRWPVLDFFPWADSPLFSDLISFDRKPDDNKIPDSTYQPPPTLGNETDAKTTIIFEYPKRTSEPSQASVEVEKTTEKFSPTERSSTHKSPTETTGSTTALPVRVSTPDSFDNTEKLDIASLNITVFTGPAYPWPSPTPSQQTSVNGGQGTILHDVSKVCGRSRGSHMARIVGGRKSPYLRWPWMISLRRFEGKSFKHKCGATLLNQLWAITAAHCVDGKLPNDVVLRLGEYNFHRVDESYPHVERRVYLMVIHPSFDAVTYENDLALLRFYDPVRLQANIVPVCLPQPREDVAGRTAVVTGWGRLSEEGELPGSLHEVHMPILTNKECEEMYSEAGYSESIRDVFVCAGLHRGGLDACEGDSGGPMLVKGEKGQWVLVGLISWGMGCAAPRQPGVYTRIPKFVDWIEEIIRI